MNANEGIEEKWADTLNQGCLNYLSDKAAITFLNWWLGLIPYNNTLEVINLPFIKR